MERTWLITGCSSGLGKGIAKAVLARGDRAALTARDPAALAAFTVAYPGRALALPLDLSHADSIPGVVAETQRAFGGIDVLVNNAGHGYRAAIEESQPHQVAELFAVNFFGPMDLIRATLPGMRERGGGWICNVTSIGGVRGALGNGDYSAAKAALERASEALAQEVAAFGIRVMLVEPGAFRTGFYGHRLAEPSTHLAAYDPIGDRYRKGPGPLPANQPGDPDRGGQRIVETLLREDAPFRLFLGSDAVEAARAAWEAGSGNSRPGRGSAGSPTEGRGRDHDPVRQHLPGQARAAGLLGGGPGAGGDRRPAPGAAGECVLCLFPPHPGPGGALPHRCLGGRSGLPGPLEPPGHPALGGTESNLYHRQPGAAL